MKRVYVMCGIPGSGKSTLAKQLAAEVKCSVNIVSRDQIRFSMISENEPYFSKEKEVFKEFSRNFVAYALIIAVSAVSVIKVHQVQRTRDLTIQYNEVKRYNDTLMREQLNLLATRENYTEYSIIRNRAINKLGMVAVKTEDETVIDLR